MLQIDNGINIKNDHTQLRSSIAFGLKTKNN